MQNPLQLTSTLGRWVCLVCEMPYVGNTVGHPNGIRHHVPSFCCSRACGDALEKYKESLRQDKLRLTDVVGATLSPLDVVKSLSEAGKERAARELREALYDATRPPIPDTTGALQHARAGVEAVAREITGKSQPNLGALINDLKLPDDIKETVKQMWHFISDNGSHGREGSEVSTADAKLAVFWACGIVAYLVERPE